MQDRALTALATALSFTLTIGLAAEAPATCGPLGGEVQENSHTALEQRNAVISADTQGRTTVVWESELQDADFWGVYMMGPSGVETLVNTYQANNQGAPDISHDPNGDFVVVWHSLGQDGDSYGIFGQRFNGGASPTPMGPEFQINTETQERQISPRIAHTGDRNSWVVWTSDDQDGDLRGIFGQCFKPTGPLNSEFQVNTDNTGEQLSPDVAGDPNSSAAVVVWAGWEHGIRGQLYQDPGIPNGGEFEVQEFTEIGNQPAVAFGPQGRFVVAFAARLPDGQKGIFARLYRDDGAPYGPEFHVNMERGDSDLIAQPDVTYMPDGTFVVTWTVRTDYADWEVRARCFDSSARPISGEFPVNEYTTNSQSQPAVTATSATDLRFAWTSKGQDGSEEDIFSRAFTTTATSVEEDAPQVSSSHAAVPTVFGTETTLRFRLSRVQDVRATIFDGQGRQVRDLGHHELGGGTHQLHWNGRDELGREVPDGVYFYSIRTQQETLSGRLVRTR